MNTLRHAVDVQWLLVLGGILGFVGVSQLLLTDPLLRYGSALLGFSLWMAWFVLAAVRWLSSSNV